MSQDLADDRSTMGSDIIVKWRPFRWLYCKTAVTPLLTHWSYCSLALSHRFCAMMHCSYTRAGIHSWGWYPGNCYAGLGWWWWWWWGHTRCKSSTSQASSKQDSGVRRWGGGGGWGWWRWGCHSCRQPRTQSPLRGWGAKGWRSETCHEEPASGKQHPPTIFIY